MRGKVKVEALNEGTGMLEKSIFTLGHENTCCRRHH
jgi:hypothetical protein